LNLAADLASHIFMVDFQKIKIWQLVNLAVGTGQ